MRITECLILTIVCLGFSCSSELDNNRTRSEIDELQFTACYVLLELDTNGIVLDTVAFEQFKHDKNSIRIYYESAKQTESGANEQMKYYWDDGTSFFETSRTHDGSLTQNHESFRNRKNKLTRSVSTIDLDDTTHTYQFIYMNSETEKNLYNMHELDGKTNSIGKELGWIMYNNEGNIKKEYLVFERNVTKMKEFFYNTKGRTQQVIVTSHSDTSSERTVVTYGENGYILLSETQKRNRNVLVSNKRTEYKYDDGPDWREFILIDSVNNEFKRRKRIKLKCD